MNRVAVALLWCGAVAVALAALPFKAFDLDRYFVPKELVLHLTAGLAALIVLARARRITPNRVDLLLAGYLALSALSALFAPNWWNAERALAVSVSGVALFWVARALARAGYRRALVAGLVLAVVLGAVTSLLQAYGVETEYFSLNRAPGGTFGNRNFMAHLAAIGTPALLYVTLTARRDAAYWAGTIGTALVAAALVLSRTRAAWLALLVSAGLVVLVGAIKLWRLREPWTGRRFQLLFVATGVVVIAALVLPNTLEWKSDSPYLETVQNVVNYKEGSGRGRLVQYGNSLDMTLAHPALGVGPGNWAVVYPHFASRRDPSLSSDGMTANPWPSSDWMAVLSERGPVAFALLVLAFVGLGVSALARVRAARTFEGLCEALALGGTVAATIVVSGFDAVLLLAPPAFIAWSLLGALSPEAAPRGVMQRATPPAGRKRGWTIAIVAALALVFSLRSALQIAAMATYGQGGRYADVEQAARLDPGSYRIQTRLAQLALRRGRCAVVRAHAGAARELFPHAREPRRLLADCGR